MKLKFNNLFMKLDRFMFIVFLMIVLQVNSGKAQLSFTDSGQRLGNGTSNSIALGDIDGDGDLDAIVANGAYNSDQDVEIWICDGKKNFTKSDQTLNHGKNAGVSLADLNGDGSLDIFLCVGFGEPNKVLFNDGHGHFTDSGQKLGDANSNLAELADLDGDCDLDAIVANNGPNKIWLNNASTLKDKTIKRNLNKPSR